jgi:hypothetical protein
MRFFRSRVGSTVYSGPGGHYFVSSEQYDGMSGRHPRRYTVREWHPETADISTVGPFNELSRSQAITRAKHYAKEGKP